MSSIYRNINSYSIERQSALVHMLNNVLWDSNYNPSEFIELLSSENQKERKWALSKMFNHLSYRDIRLLVTKKFLKDNLTIDVLKEIWSKSKQQAVKKLFQKLSK